MANPEHVALIKAGVAQWNQWRNENHGISIDLSDADLVQQDFRHAVLNGANLSGANIRDSNFADADLRRVNLSLTKVGGADFRKAILNRTDFSGADLYGVDLRKAILSRADLSGANLREADLRDTILSAANLNGTNLRDTDLSGAVLNLTGSANTNLQGARGLDLCSHEGPSSLGIDTFLRSSGEIPGIFLRGCGVPEQFITYARSLIGKAIEFYSCFISYSTKDQEFADRLHADLQNNVVRCWFAPHDIQGGRKIHEQIDEAIRVYDRLLLILSEHSMDSNWVETEISKAREREVREKRQMLFPVRLVSFEAVRDWKCFDAETGKDSAREIREYFIPDFSNWKDHDSYKIALDRLLRDLKAKPDAGAKPASTDSLS